MWNWLVVGILTQLASTTATTYVDSEVRAGLVTENERAGHVNALRHILWSGLMDYYLGSDVALRFLAAHDVDHHPVTPADLPDKISDEQNNRVGLAAGCRLRYEDEMNGQSRGLDDVVQYFIGTYQSDPLVFPINFNGW